MTDRDGCIALNLVQGIGHARFKLLSDWFGTPGQVFNHAVEEYEKLPTIGQQLSARLAEFDPDTAVAAELELAERGEVDIITLFDSEYPAVLRELHDPPLCLYIRGKLPEFPEKAVAIVGTRRMSAYGARMSEAIAADAAHYGYTVVSGLAMGVDTVAHSAVVKAGGTTVAVLGAGLAHVHPKENIPLARQIVEHGGAVISEFPIGMPPSKQNFPRRNRIVAGLCKATIVTEAGIGSGAMITARLALENNRDLFALPGNVDNPAAAGCNALIKEGATLIERFSDVAAALGTGVSIPVEKRDLSLPSDADMDELSKKIWHLLDNGETGFDEIQTALDAETGELLSALMKLELKMFIELTPEQRYRKMV
jgi:DNA processing protein